MTPARLLVDPDDPTIFCWSAGTMPPIDRSKLVGLFLPAWNDLALVQQAVPNLIGSMPVDYPFGLLLVDGGSSDGTQDWARLRGLPTMTMRQPCRGGCNRIVHELLGPYSAEDGRFEREGRFGYIGFVHSDALYPDLGWLGRLVDLAEADPSIGLIGPAHDRTAALPEGESAHNCPLWIMPVRALKLLYRESGWLFDPAFWTGVSYCDWDIVWRLRRLGLRCLVTTKCRVDHKRMGTRNRLWKSEEHSAWFARADVENRAHYTSKWPKGNPLEHV